MNSHPNYIGYDATEGNPRATPMRQNNGELAQSVGKLTAKDFHMDLPKGWLEALE